MCIRDRLVVEAADLQLERQRGWDALGMRGTCSESFELDATTRADAVFTAPVSYTHLDVYKRQLPLRLGA